MEKKGMELQELLVFASRVQGVPKGKVKSVNPIIQTMKTFGMGTKVAEIKEDEGTKELTYRDTCETCRACGNWPGHEGGPFCFYDAVFRGKPGNPKPISKAKGGCPIRDKEDNRGPTPR